MNYLEVVYPFLKAKVAKCDWRDAILESILDFFHPDEKTSRPGSCRLVCASILGISRSVQQQKVPCTIVEVITR